MKIKRSLLSLCTLLTTLMMWAGPVSQEQACEVARQWLSTQNGAMRRSAAMLPLEVKTVMGATDERQQPLLYAVNIGQQQGYVVVSGDDRLRPVLAYSDKGTYSDEAVPANMRVWLEGYVREMQWLSQHDYEGVTTAAADASRRSGVKVAIAPMVTTQWNQGAPYYYYCPIYQDEYCVVGCVATAMAQVVNYHAQRKAIPTTLLKDIPAYTSTSNKIAVPAIGKDTALVAWSELKDTYAKTLKVADEGVRAVNKLSQVCASAVSMNYRPTSSGANSEAIAPALKDYFGFSETTQLVVRDNYTIANWIELIYSELASGRPVLYSGHSSGGGHEFVIDGYDGNELFHVNWGWGGSNDGYFALSVLNPGDNSGIGASSTTDGYSYDQDATIGIQYGSNDPVASIETRGTTPRVVSLEATSGLTISGEPYTLHPQTLTVTLKNNSDDEFYGPLHFFMSTDENKKGNAKQRCGVTIVKGATETVSFSFTPTAAGKYYVWVTTDTGGSDVVASTSVDISAFATPTTVTGPLMFSFMVPDDVDPTSWSNADDVITADVYAKKVRLAPKVKNVSSEEITTGIGFQLYRKDGESWVLDAEPKRQFSSTKTHTMKPGDEVRFSAMTFNDVVPGEYKMVLSTVVGEKVGDVDNRVFTASDERYHLNVVNGFVVNTTTDDKTYAKVTEGTVVTPDNALAVDLTNVSFTDITTNSNPNTLYILSDAQETPASLTDKNVVKNGVAESISITDDYGFCAPVDFTANSVSYTRTFNKFYDGGQNWSTIVLPFAATQVSNSERTLPWDKAHRRFWLMQFSGESGSALEFTTAPTTLQAHTPYLIALPGDAYGASFSLVGKSTLTFSATNATVKAGTQAATVGTTYKMTGTLLAESGLSYVYILNDVTGTERGNRFVKTTESGSVAPFRAYIEPTSAMPRAQQLSITFGQTTGMGDTLRLNDKGETTNDSVYDLQGRRVANPSKGIYIVNGKKIIR